MTKKINGQAAEMVNENEARIIECYEPKPACYVLVDDVLKVDRILVLSDLHGNITLKQILCMDCGCRVQYVDAVEPLFATSIAENVVRDEDVDYYYSFFQEECGAEAIAEEIIGSLEKWNIDTVQKSDGSRVSVKEYVNETVLKK